MGSGEADVVSLVKKLLPESDEPFVMFEIGACDEHHTKMFTRIFNDSGRPFQIYAFEPVARNYEKLVQAVAADDDIVKCFRCAVGNDDGSVTFWKSGPDNKYWGSSSLRAPKLVTAPQNWPDMEFTESQASCVKLDTFAAEHGVESIDLIWCDVQGAEGDVVLGGEDIFAKTRYFFTEYNEAEIHEGCIVSIEQLLELLKKTSPGWEVMKDFGGEILFVNRDLEPK